jgi:hypothetical protein
VEHDRTISFHRDDLQVAAEVSSVKAANIIGSPKPYPDILDPSLAPSSSSGGLLAVLYKYVKILGRPLLRIPLPSSLTCIAKPLKI